MVLNIHNNTNSTNFRHFRNKDKTTTYLVHQALTFITYVDHESHTVTPHVAPVTTKTKTSKIEPTQLNAAFMLAEPRTTWWRTRKLNNSSLLLRNEQKYRTCYVFQTLNLDHQTRYVGLLSTWPPADTLRFWPRSLWGSDVTRDAACRQLTPARSSHVKQERARRAANQSRLHDLVPDRDVKNMFFLHCFFVVLKHLFLRFFVLFCFFFGGHYCRHSTRVLTV